MAAEAVSRRDALLAAALRSFAEHGYGATSMSDVRRAAGASTGSLYHHFPSRAHLAAALWIDGLADYQEGFLVTLGRARGAEAAIMAAVRFHLRWVRAHPDLARFLFSTPEPEVHDIAAADLAERNARFLGEVARWHGEQVARGEVRDLPLDVVYSLWIGPVQELSRMWLAGAVRTPLSRFAGELSHSAWMALRVSSAAVPTR